MWKWVNTNSPVANSRTDDIWFFDQDTGWLLNSNGQVSVTRDGGASWEEKFRFPASSPCGAYLRCFGWANEQVGWFGAVTRPRSCAPGDYLKVLLHHTQDGGETWEPVLNLPEGSPAGICGFYAVDEQVAYGSGTNDPDLPGPGIVQTVDGGASWTLKPMGEQADNLIDIYFQDETTGWVVGGKIDPSCPPDPPAYRGPGLMQYAQLRPVVLMTTDGGATWVDKAAGTEGLACGEWGWKIQFLPGNEVGFVSLENFAGAAILKTVDGGESWERIPIADAEGRLINNNLEGVGFLDPERGWVGGWGDRFTGLLNSFTTGNGDAWTAQNHAPDDPASDPRVKVNRFRFLGDPVTGGYCSGERVYRMMREDEEMPEAMARLAPPASAFGMISAPSGERSMEIAFTVPEGAKQVYVGLWNLFAVHVRTLVDETDPEPGERRLLWDGRDDEGEPLGAGAYICRLSIDGEGESATVELPE